MRYNPLVAGVVAALLLACGDSTSPQQFAILTAVSGSGQQAASLDTLGEELVVRAVDEDGDPIEGLELIWSTDDHEGAALIPASATTDELGEARARWVLGIGSGTQSADVRVPSSTFSVTFSAEALPGLQLADLMHSFNADRLCGLDASEKAWCWDAAVSGGSIQATRAGDEVTFTSLAGDDGTICGIGTDLGTYCWGETVRLGVANSDAPTKLPFPQQFTGISVQWNSSGYQACGVTFDRDAYCWGRGVMGDGDPNVRDALEPVLVSGDHDWLVVVRAVNRTCGVTQLHEVRCWGEDGAEHHEGNLEWYGIDHEGALSEPLPVQLVSDADQIALGLENACATVGDGTLCWGEHPLGDPGAPDAPGPGQLAEKFVEVAANDYDYFGLTAEGSIYIWGASSSTPARIAGAGPWRTLAPAFHTGICAILDNDSSVYCWPDATDLSAVTTELPRPVGAAQGQP